MSQKKVQLSFAEDFLLSGVAAVVSKTAAAPLERLKMVKQLEPELLKSGVRTEPFKGIPDIASFILKSDGPIGFWKSNFTNCIRYFPTQALNFAFKGQIKRMDAFKKKKTDPYALTITKNITSGGLAGFGSMCFVYHFDYARTRLAADVKSSGKGEAKYSGLIDVYKQTLASDGPVGLYRGFAISAVGIFIYRGFYFGLYDSIMPLVPKKNTNFLVQFGVGWGVTTTAGILSYPIDTIRRRMMMTSGGAVKYDNSMHCAREILKQEGVMAFFRGCGANVLRGVAGAGVLSGFDVFRKAYIDYRYPQN